MSAQRTLVVDLKWLVEWKIDLKIGVSYQYNLSEENLSLDPSKPLKYDNGLILFVKKAMVQSKFEKKS